MKIPSEPGKIYYDVTIDHDVAHKEKMCDYASKGITEITLRDPLIENPGITMSWSQSLKSILKWCP